jgi:hypothetical protein
MLYPNHSSVGIDIETVTDAQIEFIKDNKEKLDERQIYMLQQFEIL